jgi:hypothetical protein
MSQQPGGYQSNEQSRQTPPPGGTPYGQVNPGGYGPSSSGYEARSYGYGPRPTNVLAIVSLVTSIIGLGIVGIITGHIARRQIRASGESGDGIALAGLIIGYVVTVIEVLAIIAFISIFAVASSSMG